jgi:hypothetical protein
MERKWFNIATVILAVFVITGCPTLESKGTVSGIRVFIDGVDRTGGITVQQGQTVTLKADVGLDPKFASIVWETDAARVDIVSTGEGPECTLRGKEAGVAEITVRAWRGRETPVEKTIPVTVDQAEVTGIRLTGSDRIGVGEKRELAAVIVPAWAQYETVWSAAPAGGVQLEQVDGVWFIEGLAAGDVTLTGTAGGKSFPIPFTVAVPGPLTALDIFLGGISVTGTIPIGVFEEKFLSANIQPAGTFTFFEWKSSDEDNVTVDSNGVVKGMTANSSATVTVTASGLTASVTVQVANPISGVRLKYNNADALPVSNTVWLFPEDSVELQAELMPDIEGEIVWSGGEGQVRLVPGADGRTCTITGIVPDDFDTPPILLRVIARNNDNGTKPAAAVVQVKIMADEPLWAWDRARDADANESLKEYGTDPAKTSGSYSDAHGIPGYSSENPPNTAWELKGRGTMAAGMIHTIKRVKVPYTPSGLNMCSVPGGPALGANSTQLIIGSTSNENTLPVTANTPNGYHVPGVFDFTRESFFSGGEWGTRPISRQIRISVDFEVLSANGRQLAICVNNTDTAFLNSPFGNASRLAYRAINEAKGTKITYSTYLDAPTMIADQVQGHETLKDALIAISLMSNGGNIYLSGIRIEYE